ncbi:MAG: hypothetical protein WCJ84_00515 [Candidatus Peregrinibacteria bacterium]
MKVLGLDLGRHWGWAFDDAKVPDWGEYTFSSLLEFSGEIKALFDLLKPEIVVNCRAMGRNSQVIRFHGAMGGIVELICQERGIAFFDRPDSTMRKVVVGKGNAKKHEVMEFFDIASEHSADAMVAAIYGQKTCVHSL